MKTQTSVYDFSCKTLQGDIQPLEIYRGKVLLIVNTASYCGFTSQYAGLEKLYKTYQAQGFSVLAFPCNQFAQQEPHDAAAIEQFCTTRYQVTFPLFAKIQVNGNNADPLFSYLKSQAKGILGSEAIKWNFTKFLINRQGEVIARFAPNDQPEGLVSAIEACLTANA